ncbi:MAG: SAM-dependent methyltransferase [Alcaligenaceae bacterium]|nr:SAM-dependent methyltransferase [Alcaligenaceae bacterium]
MLHCLLRSRFVPVIHALTAATLSVAALGVAHAQQRPSLDVPYIKTPDAVVERMLELGQVGPDDYLIDLGSGDGRIPIAAALKHGTRGLGVDLDPARTEEARAAAQAAGVAGQVKFRTENLFDTDLSQATVISMYLFNEINLRLRPELLKLKPGTRIVAHAFHMEDWTPERHDIVEHRDIFLWTVPAQVAGLWNVEVPGHRNFVLRVWQQFDRVQAVSTTMDEHSIPAIEMTVSGPEIRYTLHTLDGEHTYTGTVDGKRMSGTSSVGDWSATKM